MTEKLLTGTLRLNTNKSKIYISDCETTAFQSYGWPYKSETVHYLTISVGTSDSKIYVSDFKTTVPVRAIVCHTGRIAISVGAGDSKIYVSDCEIAMIVRAMAGHTGRKQFITRQSVLEPGTVRSVSQVVTMPVRAIACHTGRITISVGAGDSKIYVSDCETTMPFRQGYRNFEI